jgi:hypothetical protein
MFQVNSLGEASFEEVDIFSAHSNRVGLPQSSVNIFAATRVSLGNVRTELSAEIAQLSSGNTNETLSQRVTALETEIDGGFYT